MISAPSQLRRTAGASWSLALPLLRAHVTALSGWRRRGVAFLAGAASVLALAPFFAFPVLWITLPLLVWLLEAEVDVPTGPRRLARLRAHPAWSAAEAGWWFGFGYFFAGLFWIGEAFLVEAETFAVLLPFAVTALPMGLALFWAAAAGLARMPKLSTVGRVLALAVTLSLAEYLRGHILTGFPWNVLGYVLTSPLALMQSAALVGIYGLTLVSLLVFGLPLVLWAGAPEGAAGRNFKALALAIALLPPAAMYLGGSWRLSQPVPPPLKAKVRIVQPSVPQREKWRPENQAQIFNDHLALSLTNPSGERDGLAGIGYVVWPEASMPFLPLEYTSVRQAIGQMLPPDTLLLAGALRAEFEGEGPQRRRRALFNSILVFGSGGSLDASYDKIHLVPFGEYLPFQRLMDAVGLEPLTRMRGGFDQGIRPRPLLKLPGLPPIGPLVCYEAIFPGAVVQSAERPGLLVNVTNDGWFGNTTGPRQHFHQTRVRAVEEGLPLLRAANNGISAAFDGHGRVLGMLGMNVRGTLDIEVPAAASPPFYARFGDLPFFAGTALLLAFLIWRRP